MIIQFHSTPISEPAAQIAGLVAGLIVYGIAGLATPDPNIRLWAGIVASVASNVVVGAKINLPMLDLLALLVARPVSALAGGKLLAVILGGN